MFFCRIHRSLWKSVGKTCPDFPSSSNSRHFRASGNVVMKELGTVALAQMAPEVLNHLPSTNQKYYSDLTRGKRVRMAKVEMRSIKRNLSLHIKADSGRNANPNQEAQAPPEKEKKSKASDLSPEVERKSQAAAARAKASDLNLNPVQRPKRIRKRPAYMADYCEQIE